MLSIFTGLIAAGFWLWSALISIPDILQTKLSGAGSITDLMRKQSRLSAIAAFFTAVSVLTQAAPTFCSLISG
jgi:hypothetical protein